MLEVLDISAYSDNFLERALEWLEIRQVVIFFNVARAVLRCLNLFASLISKVEVVCPEFYARASSIEVMFVSCKLKLIVTVEGLLRLLDFHVFRPTL
jgi:hypothetical protein